MTQITTLRWINKSSGKFHGTGVLRGYWRPHRQKTHDHILQPELFDCVYVNAVKHLDHYSDMLEIGSDLGRSTAWLSSVADNIDVYENNKFYLEFCRGQTNNLVKNGPIKNINWHLSVDASTLDILSSIDKQYDIAKISGIKLCEQLDAVKRVVKPGGVLCLFENLRNTIWAKKLYNSLVEDDDFTLLKGPQATLILTKYK